MKAGKFIFALSSMAKIVYKPNAYENIKMTQRIMR